MSDKIPVYGDLEVHGRVRIQVAPASPEDAVRLAEIDNVVRFYRHVQSNASDVWEITHNFGTTDISWQIIPDVAGVSYTVNVLDENTLQVIFSQPTTGIAYVFNTSLMGESSVKTTLEESIVIAIAGESLELGDIVYVNPFDSKTYKLNGTVNTNLIGLIIDSSVAAGGLAHILLKGLFATQQDIYVPDQTYYYSVDLQQVSNEISDVYLGTAISTKILKADVRWVKRIPQEIYTRLGNVESVLTDVQGQIADLQTQLDALQPLQNGYSLYSVVGWFSGVNSVTVNLPTNTRHVYIIINGIGIGGQPGNITFNLSIGSQNATRTTGWSWCFGGSGCLSGINHTVLFNNINNNILHISSSASNTYYVSALVYIFIK